MQAFATDMDATEGSDSVLFDLVNQSLCVAGAVHQLKPKTFSVLEHLVARPGQLVTKDELLDRLWPCAYVVESVLKNIVHELRTLLCDSAKSPRFIATVHRRGYRFVGEHRLRVCAKADVEQPSSPGNRTTPRAVAATIEPIAVTRSETPSTFVGREQELATLAEAWRRARGEEPQGIVIFGGPGMGKSALLAKWLRREVSLPSNSIRIGVTRCAPSSREHTYAAFLDLLGSLHTNDTGGSLTPMLKAYAPDWGRVAPWLHTEAEAVGPLPSAGGALVTQATALLEALGTERSLLLVVEDAHYCDAGTREILTLLRRRSRARGLMLVATASSWVPCRQPEVFDTDGTTGAKPWQRIVLGPLAPESVARLVAPKHAPCRLRVTVAAPLHDATKGHPLLLKDVAATDGQAVHRPGRPLPPPRAFCERMRRELEQLSRDERRHLQAASIALTEFVSSAAIAAILDSDITDVEMALDDLASRAGWIDSAGEREWPDGTLGQLYRFPLPAYRDFVYATLPCATRRSMQLRHARRLEAAYRNAVGDIAENLELHFRAIGDVKRTSRYVEMLQGDRAPPQSRAALMPRRHWIGFERVSALARGHGRLA